VAGRRKKNLITAPYSFKEKKKGRLEPGKAKGGVGRSAPTGGEKTAPADAEKGRPSGLERGKRRDIDVLKLVPGGGRRHEGAQRTETLARPLREEGKKERIGRGSQWKGVSPTSWGGPDQTRGKGGYQLQAYSSKKKEMYGIGKPKIKKKRETARKGEKSELLKGKCSSTAVIRGKGEGTLHPWEMVKKKGKREGDLFGSVRVKRRGRNRLSEQKRGKGANKDGLWGATGRGKKKRE